MGKGPKLSQVSWRRCDLNMKFGRLGLGIGHKHLEYEFMSYMESPDIGKWVKFFPGCWWQTQKPLKDTTVIKCIWEKDARKFLPECITEKGIITKEDLKWRGMKCEWETQANVGGHPRVYLVCKTCGEMKDQFTGKVFLKGANTWRKENEDDK